jgi:hypothetical protein
LKRVQGIGQMTKRKKVCFAIVTTMVLLTFCFFSFEVLLRLLPISGLPSNALRYDEVVGRGFYPNSIFTYRNDRGDYVVKTVNRWGYLDVDHERRKREGIFRIGFFGDSYTEARQVPYDATFFRQIESNLRVDNVECLAFGDSGFGTLHSYLISKEQMNFFDLDMVVYVFVENDLGDHIREIKRASDLPYAVYKDGGIVIDNSFRERTKPSAGLYQRLIRYITARSLMVRTLRNSVRSILQYGIKTKVTEQDRMMTTRSDKGEHWIPNQNDLPSTWPTSLRHYAIKLASSIILEWKNEVERKSKTFAILYVPRGGEWRKKKELQDSWKPWLASFCKKNNINFIDPTASFFAAERNGAEIYYDHFTTAGHKAFAEAFIRWFKNYGLAFR